MPTPVLNCPPAPQGGSVGADPGQDAVPGIGVFNIVRAKLKLPLSRSLHRFHTAFPGMLPVQLTPAFAASAEVDSACPGKYAGYKAASKKVCFVSAFGFMTWELIPPQFPP